MNEQWLFSHISGESMAYVDDLYERYLQAPSSVPEEWQSFFAGLSESNETTEVSHKDLRTYFLHKAKARPSVSAPVVSHDGKDNAVQSLIHAYRLYGHLKASLDPLNLVERKPVERLSLAHHGLSNSDLSQTFTVKIANEQVSLSLQEIIATFENIYCGNLGVEYLHIGDHDEVSWLQSRLESNRGEFSFSADEKMHLLKDLSSAEGLERFLHTKYVGQKRFSLEGGCSLIPMLQEIVREGGERKVREIVIGMAHRGRLNVLVNVLGKAPEEIFQEFEGKNESELSGDVKYHMGFSSDIKTRHGGVHLALGFNPSHLEIIAPVVQGSVRSRQRRRDDLEDKKQVVPVVIHGDAAFAGQGVVMETFNFSQARGYSVGGTIHIVVNNQVGFTTSNPLDARSTLYCTDVAKMVGAPILHVNGDSPEDVLFATKIAFDYRMKFKRDVVIDLVCYRRHGHNEADEPSVTQPKMYQVIKALKRTRELYADKLIAEGLISQEEADALMSDYRKSLERGKTLVEFAEGEFEGKIHIGWKKYLAASWTDPADTTVALEKIRSYDQTLRELPEGFVLHPVVKRLYQDREKMAKGELAMNWGFAETMAYASLVDEGFAVRLSGQDSGRGTFAHRHAAIHCAESVQEYVPLQHISERQKQFIVIDSVLSEEGVLGFEYGFSAAEPNALVIWEAQFGDFANGAQVVIDQFISSGEQKWGRLCGLVMFLPHGFEGQGPEHSSARLERYLQLCAQNNMQVCVPTTPSQIFHLLRRQMIRDYRKPLIVMTPKSLLRHKLAVSPLEDLSEGQFHNVIPEIDELNPAEVKRVVLCSGKVYYDLLAWRREQEINDVALVRVEQLYPFPKERLKEILGEYEQAKEVVWCQEEPKNQGAWYCSSHHMRASLNHWQELSYVGREFCAAPAVGSAKLHAKQQKALVEQALMVSKR
jgi:2-oxoglutarate dehydrogenase E1 component